MMEPLAAQSVTIAAGTRLPDARFSGSNYDIGVSFGPISHSSLHRLTALRNECGQPAIMIKFWFFSVSIL
jgi:hypothetical protein